MLKALMQGYNVFTESSNKESRNMKGLFVGLGRSLRCVKTHQRRSNMNLNPMVNFLLNDSLKSFQPCDIKESQIDFWTDFVLRLKHSECHISFCRLVMQLFEACPLGLKLMIRFANPYVTTLFHLKFLFFFRFLSSSWADTLPWWWHMVVRTQTSCACACAIAGRSSYARLVAGEKPN